MSEKLKNFVINFWKINILFIFIVFLFILTSFVIGILRISFPIIDKIFYCSALYLIYFFIIIIYLNQNKKWGLFFGFVFHFGMIIFSLYFINLYLPGYLDYPLLVFFFLLCLIFSLSSLIIFISFIIIKKEIPIFKKSLAVVERKCNLKPNFKKAIKTILISLLIINTGIIGFYFTIAEGKPIKIIPKNYKIQVVLWAYWNHSLYSHQQLVSISNNSAHLYLYNIYPEEHLLPNSTYYSEFLESMQVFKNYSIKVFFCPGLIKEYPTREENFEWIINVSYSYLEWLDSHPQFDPKNGGNFAGVCVDIESNKEFVQINRTKYNEIVKNYEKCVDEFHKRNLIYIMDSGNYVMHDGFDSDSDLDQRKGIVTTGIHNFDLYSWQSYRATDKARPSMSVYTDAAISSSFWGPEKTQIFIGITGMEPYECKNISSNENKGLEQLILDTLILKHFLIAEVGIFILTYSDPSIGCYEKCGKGTGNAIEFFQAYGDDALDIFCEKVNGQNSTKPFTIQFKKETYAFYSDFFIDIILNLNGLAFFIIMLTWSILILILKNIFQFT